MKRLIKKISPLIIVLLLSIIPFSIASAQSGLFDTLDTIKDKVGEEQVRVGEGGETETVSANVVDFSEGQPWGNLPEEVIEMVKGSDASITSLKKLAEKAGYSKAEKNINDLINYIGTTINNLAFLDQDGNIVEDADQVDSQNNPVILLNDNGYLIVNEIRYSGESQIQSAILAIAKVLRNIIGAFAVLWIVVSGIQMVLAGGDESKITEQKRAITYAVIGLMVILLLERGITLIYGVPGVERGLSTAGPGISEEIIGVIAFAKALIGAAAILMIMINGFKTITAQGEEDKITTQKKAILWVIVGLVVIMVNEFAVENLFIEPAQRQIAQSQEFMAAGEEIIPQDEQEGISISNVQNLINLFGSITQFILGFVGIIAFAALIYGAASMIGNYGNDEMVEKSKKIIRNALIGIVVILSAFALISTVIKFQ
ncbi:hypothetical protein KAR91_75490 [Candidatus Pacearchaeota archaeon]|nr:hypothetical protein [Candidatus Pacearchaeota archaeon]